MVALAAAVFGRAVGLPFVALDDPEYVTANPHLAGGLSARSLAWALSTGHAANWHPLTWLSHLLDVTAFGLAPAGHHAVSLVLHCASALLLFLLLERTTEAPWRSALAALLFAVHPLRVESVAWVSERKDVLATFFWLATALAHAAWVRSPGPGRRVLLLALFALGLASKAMLVTLPFALLLLDAWPLRRIDLARPDWRRAWPLLREKAPLFALSAASSAVTFLVQRDVGAMRPLAGVAFPDRAANALVSVFAYLGKILWPTRLAVFYPYPASPPAWPVLAGLAAALAAITWAAFRARARAPHLLVGWLWFLGTLVPVLGLVQVGNQAMADRYTYVPSIGIALAAAWSVPRLPGRRAAALAAAAAAAVVASLGLLAARQVGRWESDERLFAHALAVTGENWMAEGVLGTVAERRGDLGGAIARYREALRLNPNAPEARNNLGNALVTAGAREEGIAHLREAVRRWPGYVGALSNLGAALCESGRLREGAAILGEAVARAPDHLPSRFNLAMALEDLGLEREALAQLEAAARLAPGDAAVAAHLQRLRARVGR
ncbi:MAG TPA: tetratricopeptide repeat protein [Anaeromyxobacteraceae bacterium]|nr:tetratricopeptide repeat protein [Anaeromyxobacteraceae bacterium]